MPQRQPDPSPGRVNDFNGLNDNQGRSAHIRKVQPESRDPAANNRFQVNMDARPALQDLPSFGAGQHLRRRSEPPPNRFATNNEAPRLNPSGNVSARKILDQSQLDQLLGKTEYTDNHRKPLRAYTPLQQDTRIRPKCMHCGREDHMSFDCPSKPTLRQQVEPIRQQGEALRRPLPQQSEAVRRPLPQQEDPVQRPLLQPEAALERFNSQQGEAARRPLPQQAEPVQKKTITSAEPFAEMTDRRRNIGVNDRRSNRIRLEDYEVAERTSRFEEPQRRHRTNYERRTRRVMQDEDEDDGPSADRAELKRQRKEARKQMKAVTSAPVPIQIPQFISVINLASMLRVRVEDFVAKLEDLGFEEVQNDHILNAEHAGLIAQEYNFEPIMQSEENDVDLYPAPALSPEDYVKLPARPPVVTIMGHVDHGKTTILDFIRSTAVAASEFGGITQHIGAFSVPIGSGKNITFLDTPGHAAFETMRARGANVTDIVVLVVAADDSVMPQTVEAIKHAQAANVAMIVAINKIDIPNADPAAVKLDLGRYGIEVEEFGGDIQAIPVSGLTGQGIPDLEEAISTLSEMLDHRADPNAKVEGWVLEGTTKKSGKAATVLVRKGTLRIGDIIVAGTTWARVRSLHNEAGVAVKEVGPGMPVEVDGWREQPIAGDEVLQATDEREGQSVADSRMEKVEREQMAKDMEAVNESRRLEAERREAEAAAAKAAADGEEAEEAVVVEKKSGPELISVIVKGDVSGSVEAVIDSVSALGNAECGVRILRYGVGPPSEFDIQHAAAASGHIISFNTAIPSNIAGLAEHKGVKILDHNIIYRVVEDIKTMLEDKLPPRVVERVTGEVDVAMIFDIGLGGKKKLRIAGSKVRTGSVHKGDKVKVLRKNEIVYKGMSTPFPIIYPVLAIMN
jgi:translation initiation factor IF-2